MLETLLQPGDTIERCGLLLRDGTAVELENVAPEPVNSYQMDPVESLKLMKTGDVIGTWHTHPDGSPNLSGEDYASFLNWPNLEHHIVGLEKGKPVVATFRVKDGVIFRCD